MFSSIIYLYDINIFTSCFYYRVKQKLDLYFGVKTLYINSLLNDRNYL